MAEKRPNRLDELETRLAAIGGRNPADAVHEIIKDLFGFDYDIVPVLRGKKEGLTNRELLAEELEKLPSLTVGHLCPLLLRMFGTNLEGIVSIERSPISIRSKENWVKRHDGDLVMITGGYEDLDVLVTPTEEFMTVNGNEYLPEDLLDRLIEIGYENRDGHAFYADPEGKPVTDDFKTLTIRTITEYFDAHPYQ
ncbi:hypothetical protein C772_00355 [Bhargavaea cecembensis DSE10]|uniref:Uncharacterized protein n=1 Tax=Bhargavaea cecembensis DSE10 TaxID=1235279 RepID=M7PA36_9BACL|nr:hypothetical protein [Bhargavaea cecembensis]EMR07339.1 hypothetical protein C772_00355 [Bhargavaea cecembensis DSE10]